VNNHHQRTKKTLKIIHFIWKQENISQRRRYRQCPTDYGNSNCLPGWSTPNSGSPSPRPGLMT